MHMKKIFSLALLLTTLTASMASASVQTGSIQKVNLDLKYPLVYTQNQTAQKKINQDIESQAVKLAHERGYTIVFNKFRVNMKAEDITAAIIKALKKA